MSCKTLMNVLRCVLNSNVNENLEKSFSAIEFLLDLFLRKRFAFKRIERFVVIVSTLSHEKI